MATPAFPCLPSPFLGREQGNGKRRAREGQGKGQGRAREGKGEGRLTLGMMDDNGVPLTCAPAL